MEDSVYFFIGSVIIVVLLVEYIYHCTYIPNLKKAAQNNYQDW
jgi:hypothetical protein